jgi:hypothetical protein
VDVDISDVPLTGLLQVVDSVFDEVEDLDDVV